MSETGESANHKYVNLKTLVNQWIVNVDCKCVIESSSLIQCIV